MALIYFLAGVFLLMIIFKFQVPDRTQVWRLIKSARSWGMGTGCHNPSIAVNRCKVIYCFCSVWFWSCYFIKLRIFFAVPVFIVNHFFFLIFSSLNHFSLSNMLDTSYLVSCQGYLGQKISLKNLHVLLAAILDLRYRILKW